MHVFGDNHLLHEHRCPVVEYRCHARVILSNERQRPKPPLPAETGFQHHGTVPEDEDENRRDNVNKTSVCACRTRPVQKHNGKTHKDWNSPKLAVQRNRKVRATAGVVVGMSSRSNIHHIKNHVLTMSHYWVWTLPGISASISTLFDIMAAVVGCTDPGAEDRIPSACESRSSA